MTSINLLPHHLRPIKRTPVPYLAALTVAAAILTVAGMSFIRTQARIGDTSSRLDGLRAEIARRDSIIKESKELENKKKVLADKIATINEIVAGRIIWSRQLFNLARVAPPNLWYSNIKVEKKPFVEMRPVVNPQTKQTETKRVVIDKPVLSVSGYVAATENAGADVSSFALAAEEDAEFSDLFLLYTVPQLSDTEFEGSAVKRFTLDFQILSGTDG